MAVVFTKKTSEIALILTIIINLYGYSFGQCLKKHNQEARCKNMDYDLGKGQCWTKDLKGCLEGECIKIFGSSNEKDCKIIPRFNNTLRISKTLTIETFLQEILQRTEIHINHNKEIRQYFKSTNCHKKTKLVKYQMKRIKSWIKRTQRDLGFSTSSSPKLTSTGAKSLKDWYIYVQIQMLINLSLEDFSDMRGYFQTSTMNNKACIIPAC